MPECGQCWPRTPIHKTGIRRKRPASRRGEREEGEGEEERTGAVDDPEERRRGGEEANDDSEREAGRGGVGWGADSEDDKAVERSAIPIPCGRKT